MTKTKTKTARAAGGSMFGELKTAILHRRRNAAPAPMIAAADCDERVAQLEAHAQEQEARVKQLEAYVKQLEASVQEHVDREKRAANMLREMF